MENVTTFRITKGIDLQLPGEPRQQLAVPPRPISTVALLCDDFPGQRCSSLVERGDRVRLGQPLAVDRDRPEIQHTSPGTGTIREIIRGDRRKLLAIVVELSEEEEEPQLCLDPRTRLSDWEASEISQHLLTTGMWTALRTRPFDRIPDPTIAPRSIFVTAMETTPYAPSAEVVVAEDPGAFVAGLEVLSRLTRGSVFVCRQPGSAIPTGQLERVRLAEFEGPHPAGLVGTHVHFLDPVEAGAIVWHVGTQDLMAIGRLFTTGRISVARVVALAGPRVERPRLVRTRLGANTDELVAGELSPGPARIVSGSVLSGRQASSWGRFLGRFHSQVCALEEIDSRRSGWLRFSRHYDRGTSALHGKPTAFYPTGAFERVVPLDLLVTPLLRALVVGDVEKAQTLGCLEIAEEDLALCTYVCPGKQEYGPLLRAALEQIEALE